MGFDCFADFLPDAKHFSAVDKSTFTHILSESAWSHAKLLSTGIYKCVVAYTQFVQSRCMEDTLQDALKT